MRLVSAEPLTSESAPCKLYINAFNSFFNTRLTSRAHLNKGDYFLTAHVYSESNTFIVIRVTKRTSMFVYKHVNATSILIGWSYYIVIWKKFVEMKACNSADMCGISEVFVRGPDRAGAKNHPSSTAVYSLDAALGINKLIALLICCFGLRFQRWARTWHAVTPSE